VKDDYRRPRAAADGDYVDLGVELGAGLSASCEIPAPWGAAPVRAS
jgi:hypothetical protein